MTEIKNWTEHLRQQLDHHWTGAIRPRLAGLTDEEYFWEPAAPAWNIRRRGEPGAPIQAGSGEFVIDFEMPEPTPPPVTTIAWRLGHVIVGVLAVRNAAHFGGPPADYMSFDYAGSADAALAQLDAAYRHWNEAVAALSAEALATPVGKVEGEYADSPMADLVLHINREVIHHLAEVALLRDLYRARALPATPGEK